MFALSRECVSKVVLCCAICGSSCSFHFMWRTPLQLYCLCNVLFAQGHALLFVTRTRASRSTRSTHCKLHCCQSGTSHHPAPKRTLVKLKHNIVVNVFGRFPNLCASFGCSKNRSVSPWAVWRSRQLISHWFTPIWKPRPRQPLAILSSSAVANICQELSGQNFVLCTFTEG